VANVHKSSHVGVTWKNRSHEDDCGQKSDGYRLNFRVSHPEVATFDTKTVV